MTTRPPDRWPDWMMSAYLIGTVITGALGLDWVTGGLMDQELPAPWPEVYSILLMAGGLVGFAGILLHVRKATVWAVVSLSIATLIHGLTLMSGGAYQTGLRLAVAPLMMIPAIMGWNFWMTWRSLQRTKDEEK
jgi:hypothetical protein